MKTETGTAVKSSLTAKIAGYIKKMQTRERWIVAAVVVVILIIVSSEIAIYIDEAFATQELRLEKTLSEIDDVSSRLTKYTILKNRRKAIEDAYKQVEFEGPAFSYLETLLKEKAGIAAGSVFTIKDKPPRFFGGGYEQTPYTIRFTTVDMNRLVEFLKALTEGSRPVLLAGVDIKPRPARDSLDVELEISSIRRSTAEVAAPKS